MIILLLMLALQQPVYLLRIHPPAGQVVRHRLSVETDYLDVPATLITSRVLRRTDSVAVVETISQSDTMIAVDTVLIDQLGGGVSPSSGQRMPAIFPVHPVSVGAAWTNAGGTDSLVAYELDSLRHIIVTIHSQGRLELPEIDGVSSSGTVRVVSRFDLTDHVLLYQRTHATGRIVAAGQETPISHVSVVQRLP